MPEAVFLKSRRDDGRLWTEIQTREVLVYPIFKQQPAPRNALLPHLRDVGKAVRTYTYHHSCMLLSFEFIQLYSFGSTRFQYVEFVQELGRLVPPQKSESELLKRDPKRCKRAVFRVNGYPR